MSIEAPDMRKLLNRVFAVGACLLLIFSLASLYEPESASALGPLRQRLRERFGLGRHASGADGQSQKGAAGPGQTAGPGVDFEIGNLAGLEVAIWSPQNVESPWPLVVFSHGFHGFDMQSKFIMNAMAKAGYIVVAPNHRDAIGGGKGLGKPEVGLGKPHQWTDKTHKDRGDDIIKLLDELRNDHKFRSKIDWSRVALSGHSLGGYAVLALGGAWPSWKVSSVPVKAILALSPYCQPFVWNGDLGAINAPVMYQSGTADIGVAPFVKRKEGAFDKTSSPAYYVEFEGANHFSWSNVSRNKEQQELINHYCVAFLNRFVKGDATAKPEMKLPGITILNVK